MLRIPLLAAALFGASTAALANGGHYDNYSHGRVIVEPSVVISYGGRYHGDVGIVYQPSSYPFWVVAPYRPAPIVMPRPYMPRVYPIHSYSPYWEHERHTNRHRGHGHGDRDGHGRDD
jgi:hypothetical protein